MTAHSFKTVEESTMTISASHAAYDTSLPIQDRKDANFNFLKEFLKHREEIISKDLFKAILRAMNGMTVYHQTKDAAIKNSAAQYNVTQVDVKKIIDSMHIVSSRAIQQKLLRSSTHSREYALTRVVSNRVFRDDLKEQKLI